MRTKFDWLDWLWVLIFCIGVAIVIPIIGIIIVAFWQLFLELIREGV